MTRHGAGFREGEVEADGFRIRYLEAGAGDPLVYFHGGGGLHPSAALDILAERFHVLAFELPGFGSSPENTRTGTLEELAETMALAVEAAGVERYALLGTSFGAATGLRLALAHEERLTALVLESPSAFRPEDFDPRSLTPEQLERALFAFPERRFPPAPPEIQAKQLALLGRLMGPNRDPELEARLSGLSLPVLVVFGTRDGLVSPRMGSLYKRQIVNCSLVFMYDAAHEIQFDRPEAFAGLVADFVERQEAFVVNAESHLLDPKESR
jgi:pimeloyl-ACP methyl ester carboxylesterase